MPNFDGLNQEQKWAPPPPGGDGGGGGGGGQRAQTLASLASAEASTEALAKAVLPFGWLLALDPCIWNGLDLLDDDIFGACSLPRLS